MLIDVELLKENEDGSAVYSFNLSEDMKDAFVRFGIMQAIKAGIEAAKELQPDFDNDWTPEDMAYRPGGLAQPEEQQRRDKRQPLIEKEIEAVYEDVSGQSLRPQDYRIVLQFARAIEAKLKEKNA